jgi:flagellar M-ring protein FliF
VLALARLGGAPPRTLLYAGLDPAVAGEVVAALEQARVAHEVRGDAIYVDASQRDSLRMSLASQGLPAAGGAGYELLDRLSGFGTTAQMFDAAYLRAKEGELARTIAASPFVRAARVHLAVPQGRPFRRDLRPSASVTVTTRSGALDEAQARAIRHLVAASVAGLAPADVAVVDSVAGLIAPPEGQQGAAPGGLDRAAQLRANVERLLAARVGAGRVLVEVSVDLVNERESITERRIDPQSRVAISTDTEERTGSSQGNNPGVTVASNLPEGDAAGGSESRSTSAETRERVNFEVSEVSRAVERGAGAVRRQTVAVLVDGVRRPDGTWAPRDEAELAALRDLVAAAVGFDEARGDVLTLRSLEFEPVAPAGSVAQASIWSALDPMRLIQMAVIAAVILVLALFVLRPLLLGARRETREPPLRAGALPAPALAGLPVLDGEIEDPYPDPRPVPRPAADMPEGDGGNPVERLRRLIAERQTESVEILRSWMEEREDAR